VPFRGVEIVSVSCAPVAVSGPRAALHLISAFCNNCCAGLAAVPAKSRGAPRSATSRIAVSVTAMGAIMEELRGGEGGSGGSSTSVGAAPVPRGAR
jgi:hypothetical protein